MKENENVLSDLFDSYVIECEMNAENEMQLSKISINFNCLTRF